MLQRKNSFAYFLQFFVLVAFAVCSTGGLAYPKDTNQKETSAFPEPAKKRFKGNKDLSNSEAEKRARQRVDEIINKPSSTPGTSGGTSHFLPGTSGGTSRQEPGTSGGGNVLTCDEHTYLADTRSLIQKLPALPFLLKKYNIPEVWREAARIHFNKIQAGFGDLILQRLQQLRFIFVGRLPLLGDDQIPNDASCIKSQLAIQDLETGIVAVDPRLFHKLTRTEHFLFEFHEALISLQKTKEDTTPIRAEIADFLSDQNLEKTLESVLNENYIEVPELVRSIFQMNLFLMAGDVHFTELVRSQFGNLSIPLTLTLKQCSQTDLDLALIHSLDLTADGLQIYSDIFPYAPNEGRFTKQWQNCVRSLLDETKTIGQLNGIQKQDTEFWTLTNQQRVFASNWMHFIYWYSNASFDSWDYAEKILDMTPLQAAFFLAANTPPRGQYLAVNDWQELDSYIDAANLFIDAAKKNGQLHPQQLAELQRQLEQFSLRINQVFR